MKKKANLVRRSAVLWFMSAAQCRGAVSPPPTFNGEVEHAI